MSWKEYTVFFVISIILMAAVSSLQIAPGYMDAEYYYGMGLRIAKDHSLSEPFLWNYLNGYSGISQPAFLFWMPMPALVAAFGIFITGWQSFIGAKIVFLAAAASISPLLMKLVFDITGERRSAIMGAFFGLLPTFYIPFLGTSDSFSLLMILGSVFFLVIRRTGWVWKNLLLGVIAGLFHLTRADGLLWLLVSVFSIVNMQDNKIKNMLMCGFGYVLIMTPWFIRNWVIIGNLFPPGSSKMLWLTEYNDLFVLNPETLNFSNWLGQGFGEIIKTLGWALKTNLGTALIVQGQIILVPLIILGLIKYWKTVWLRSAFFAWILTFIVMTFAFPFAGARGGYFHSGSALQPVIWVLAAIGLGELVSWGEKNREWAKNQAELILGAGLVIILLSMTVFLVFDRIIGNDITQPQWNRSYFAAEEIGTELDSIRVPVDSLLMINNPPGLYIATDRSSIVIPVGGRDAVLEAARRFNAEYLILEKNHPTELDDLYLNPQNDSSFDYLLSVSGVHYFRILPGEE